MADLVYEKCPNCGKDFLILDKNTWAYKRCDGLGGKRYFCKWSCVRAWDKVHPPRKRSAWYDFEK